MVKKGIVSQFTKMQYATRHTQSKLRLYAVNVYLYELNSTEGKRKKEKISFFKKTFFFLVHFFTLSTTFIASKTHFLLRLREKIFFPLDIFCEYLSN